MSPEAPQPQLLKTPLNEVHRDLGGAMDPFGGWDMPVRYVVEVEENGKRKKIGGDLQEHMAVRENVGLFDVSHMGRVIVQGPDTLRFLNYVTTNDVNRIENGQAQYTLMCYPDGGIVDDLIISRAGDAIQMVINAGNRGKDLAWIRERSEGFNVEINNVSDETVLLALQGPKAVDVLARLTSVPISELGKFRVANMPIADVEMIVSRTGYTGEDGFELWFAAQEAERIWRTLLGAGKDFGILPCGLGARDTLRLEAGLSLYGHEIDEKTNPFEARLDWIVKLDKGDFVGREALLEVKEQGVRRKLTGFRLEKNIPRAGNPILLDGQEVGTLVSGTFSPKFKGIATGYVPPELADQYGTEVVIQIGDHNPRPFRAEITQLPFYKRAS